MWVYVRNKFDNTGITHAAFNYTYQNHGGGWYWVNAPRNSWLYITASGFNSANQWTNGYGTLYVYLAKPFKII